MVNMYNVEAMLSLYEASHLRVHGEQILEEALTFTTSHLESMLPNMTNPLRSQVSEALKQPIHKRLIRLVECYFWALGVYFESKYYLARKFISKLFCITSIIDDIYDIYGTLDELKIFKDAVQRFKFILSFLIIWNFHFIFI
nr:(-)-germacrene D synthase-like [Ipomoea batatas]